MSKNNGGPAFPREDYEANGGNGHLGQEGMSLRDYFAAKIFAALIAGGHLPADATSEDQAKMAYKYADSMLMERAK